MSSGAALGALATLLRSARGLPHRLAHAWRVAMDLVAWAVTLQLATRVRVRRQARLIRRSGLFNAAFYLSQCGTDPDARRDPLEHYLLRGAAAGLEPSPLFDSAAYLEGNPSAAAPRNNPLVDFIRSGGSAARVAPNTAANASVTHVLERETLLLNRPILARPMTPRGPDAGRILVVDPRMQTPGGEEASVRTFGIVKLLHELGCAVTFVSERPMAADPDDPLRQLGIDVRDGFPATLAHLAAEGHRYRSVLLSGAEQTFRYLPAVRAYCLGAKVLYDPMRLQAPRPNGEHAGTTRSREQADRLERMHRVNLACCDVVLAVTPEERHALLAKVPGARVEVTPQFHAWGRDTDVKGRLEFLLFGPSVAERNAHDDKPLQEGWPA